MNVGPMPNGEIQPEFVTTLQEIGEWTSTYGESIYETRGGVIKSQDWGTVTKKGNTLYVHILNVPKEPYVFIPEFQEKVITVTSFDGLEKIRFKQLEEGVFLYPSSMDRGVIDTILKMEIE